MGYHVSDETANEADGFDPTLIRTREDFARMLTAVRVRAGYTVRDLAKAVDIPFTTLGGYLRGRHLPTVRSADLLPKILRACEISRPDEIARWQDAWNRVRQQPGPTPAGAPVPYLGLTSFRVEDAEWFYGRDTLIDDLMGRLTCQYSAGGLLIVIGPSGSGKSSLLQAGLVPALRAGELPVPGSTDWPVLRYIPGKRPLAELAAELSDDPDRAGAFDPAQWPALVGSRGRVIVVDQFEELFTTCQDEDERQSFVDALHAATQPAATQPTAT